MPLFLCDSQSSFKQLKKIFELLGPPPTSSNMNKETIKLAPRRSLLHIAVCFLVLPTHLMHTRTQGGCSLARCAAVQE